MNASLYIYILSIFITAIGLSGINFEKIIKKNKVIEVRILAIVLSIAIGFLVGEFVINILNIS